MKDSLCVCPKCGKKGPLKAYWVDNNLKFRCKDCESENL
jgi:hypothetical protein